MTWQGTQQFTFFFGMELGFQHISISSLSPRFCSLPFEHAFFSLFPLLFSLIVFHAKSQWTFFHILRCRCRVCGAKSRINFSLRFRSMQRQIAPRLVLFRLFSTISCLLLVASSRCSWGWTHKSRATQFSGLRRKRKEDPPHEWFLEVSFVLH